MVHETTVSKTDRFTYHDVLFTHNYIYILLFSRSFFSLLHFFFFLFTHIGSLWYVVVLVLRTVYLSCHVGEPSIYYESES